MKKNYLFILFCLLSITTVFSQERLLLSAWDFEGTEDDNLAFFVDDDENGVIRAWVKPNEGNVGNIENAKFSYYREGVDTDGTSIGYYAGMTSVTTTIYGKRCLNADGWGYDPIQALRYWYMENISTEGIKDIEIELNLASVGTAGMTQFRFDYKIGNGEWIIGTFKDVRTGCSSSSKLGSSPADLWINTLPVSCENQPKISCRWVSNDVNQAGNQILKSAGSSRVDNIKISGVPSGTGISDTVKELNLIVDKNGIKATEDIQIIVYTIEGACVSKLLLETGQYIVLPKGFYIIETHLGRMKIAIN